MTDETDDRMSAVDSARRTGGDLENLRCPAANGDGKGCKLTRGHIGAHLAYGGDTWYEPDDEDDLREKTRTAAAAFTDDGKRCGIVDGRKGKGCILDQGHDGAHSDGGRTWADKPAARRNSRGGATCPAGHWVERLGARCNQCPASVRARGVTPVVPIGEAPEARMSEAGPAAPEVDVFPDAKAAGAPVPVGRYEPAIRVADVRRSPFNHRKTFTGLEELGASIKAKGLINPITVRPAPIALQTGKRAGKVDPAAWELIAGERRWRAAELVGVETLPAIVLDLTDVEVLEIQLIENVQRADVHPLEEADGYRELMDNHGYTAERISEKTGKSLSTIYARLKLCELGEASRKLFLESGMHASIALAIARVPPALQGQAAKEVMGLGSWDVYNASGVSLPEMRVDEHRGGERKAEPMTVRQALHHIQRRFMLRLADARFDPTDAALTSAGACVGCVYRTGNQPELFSDVPSADVCTNPPCFESKTQAAFAVAAAQAKAAGVQVIAGKKADELFAGKHLRYEAEQKYFEPKGDVPYNLLPDSVKKPPKWEKLLGKELAAIPKVIVQDPDGAPRELYDREAAEKILRAAGKVPKPAQARAAARSGDNSAAKKIAATKQRRAVAALALRELATTGGATVIEGTGSKAAPWWRWVLSHVVTILGVDDQHAIAKALGLEVKTSAANRGGGEVALLKYIENLDVQNARGVLVALLACPAAAGSTWSSGFGKAFTDACSTFGVDLKRLQGQVADEAKGAKKPAAKAGKKGAAKR